MTFDEISAGADDSVTRALRHLRDGGLLAHPTSGVYGIGGRRHPELEREVERLKGRGGGPGIVYLVDDPDTVSTEYPGVYWPDAALRLAASFWPGPLTLVLEDGSEHGVAVRAEAHPFTRDLLVRLGAPLGSTSLNRSGDPPASDEEAARTVLRAMPSSAVPVLLVADGRLPGPPPSTIVRVSRGSAEVLRSGAIGPDKIRRVLDEGDVSLTVDGE